MILSGSSLFDEAKMIFRERSACTIINCISVDHPKFIVSNQKEEFTIYMSQYQNSSKFLSVSYLMKTVDVIVNFSSSHNTTDHT